MAIEDSVREIFGQAIAEFANSPDFQDLIAGRLGPAQVRAFIRNLFLPHYQSAHILAFAYALLANEASALIKDNMLEEMGEAEGEESHPSLLLKLARGVGLSDEEIADLVAASEE